MGRAVSQSKGKGKKPKPIDLSWLDEILDEHRGEAGALIPVLQKVQEHYGYVFPEAVTRMAQVLQIYPSRIYGVLTFYTQFSLEPLGKHLVKVCTGTACHVKGSHRVAQRVHDDLRLEDGKDTTGDGLFTVQQVACVGACSIAPVVVIDKKVHGKMTPDKTARALRKIVEKENE